MGKLLTTDAPEAKWQLIAQRMRQIDGWLRTLSAIRLIFVIGMSSFLVLLPLSPLLSDIVKIEGPSRNPFEGKVPISTAVLWMVLLTPIFETVIFQWAVLRICRTVRILRPAWIAILISALLFGLAHGGGPILVAATFAIGLILAYGYLLSYPTDSRAVAVVAASHILHNLLAVFFRSLA